MVLSYFAQTMIIANWTEQEKCGKVIYYRLCYLSTVFSDPEVNIPCQSITVGIWFVCLQQILCLQFAVCSRGCLTLLIVHRRVTYIKNYVRVTTEELSILLLRPVLNLELLQKGDKIIYWLSDYNRFIVTYFTWDCHNMHLNSPDLQANFLASSFPCFLMSSRLFCRNIMV